MRRWLSWLVLTAGCGRLSFDGHGSGDAGVGGEGGNGSGDVYWVCGQRVVPDPLTVRGTTLRYTSFDNDRTSIPTVTARVLDRTSGTTLGMTTSDGNGQYELAVATGAKATDVRMVYERTGYYSTVVVPDRALDADVTGMNGALWMLGDAPLWDAIAMDSVYQVAGVDMNANASTVNVAVRDCAGNAIEGVTVTVDPPPGLLAYQAADGRPSAALTSTVAPFAHALLHNAVPGRNRIMGTKAGRVFVSVELDVPAGAFNTLTILRAID